MPLNKIQSFKPTVYIPVSLQKRLETIHSYPLIILQAASGFGKTTVISEYLRKSDEHQVYLYGRATAQGVERHLQDVFTN